jgi:hypothetical protein
MNKEEFKSNRLIGGGAWSSKISDISNIDFKRKSIKTLYQDLQNLNYAFGKVNKIIGNCNNSPKCT